MIRTTANSHQNPFKLKDRSAKRKIKASICFRRCDSKNGVWMKASRGTGKDKGLPKGVETHRH